MELLLKEIQLIKGIELQQITNPWINITKNINNKLHSNYTKEFIHDCYIKHNTNSFFYNSHTKNTLLEKILNNKKVIIVGPAPYLDKLNSGDFIDKFDIVVRIEGGATMGNERKYGKKQEGIASNLNLTNNYRDKLINYLSTRTNTQNRPKFIITSDSVVGKNKYIHQIEKDFESKFNIPVISLMKNNTYLDRNRLFWEIYPKNFVETIDNSKLIWNANFNNGYGVINMLCGYSIKELFITGFDFYNVGLDTINLELGKMYSKDYQDYVGNKEGIYRNMKNGHHNALAQLNHLKYLLTRTCKKVILDERLTNILNDSNVIKRLEEYAIAA